MSILSTFLDRFARLQIALSAITVVLLMATVAAEVFVRHVLNASLGSTHEIVTYYFMIPIAFFPLMYIEMADRHISTDLFFRNFPPKAQQLSILAAGLIAAVIYGILSWYTFEQALKSTAKGEVSMGARVLPIWIVRWVLPVVFLSSTLAALSHTASRLVGKVGQDG